MKAFILLVLPMFWGCAADGAIDREGRQYQRLDGRLQAIEEFELRKQACAEAGGVLQVQRYSGARQRPRAREMRAATCARVSGTAAGF